MERSRSNCRWIEMKRLPGKPDLNMSKQPLPRRSVIFCSGKDLQRRTKLKEFSPEQNRERKAQILEYGWSRIRDGLQRAYDNVRKEEH